MNIEDRARRAGHDLRQATPASVDAALGELQVAAPRRRRAHAAAAACAVVAVVGLIGAARWLLPSDAGIGQPATQPGASTPATQTSADRGDGCDLSIITCHGGRSYTVALDVAMDWTLPRGFDAPYSGSPPDSQFIETYLNDGRAGVSVLQDVSAASPQSAPGPVPGIGSAPALATWISQRPFLESSSVRTDRVDGHPAWTVEAQVGVGRPPGPATCNGRIKCYPLMVQDDGSFVGAWRGMTSRYTVMELPGAGITVLWSWTFDSDIPPAVDDLVASVRFD